MNFRHGPDVPAGRQVDRGTVTYQSAKASGPTAGAETVPPPRWGLQRTPHGWGAFKEGHGDGFQHYMIVYPVDHAPSEGR